MMRQGCTFAYTDLFDKFEGLLWRVSLDHYNIQRPEGIQVNDLYQEAKIGLYESFFTYQEKREVGLAHYSKICAESSVKSDLRRCRGKAYKLIDSRFSLDMSVTEDSSLSLQDLVACENLEYNPSFVASIEEVEETLRQRLENLKLEEKEIYKLWNKGYSYRDIAASMDCNVKRIDNVVQKIKRIALKY